MGLAERNGVGEKLIGRTMDLVRIMKERKRMK